MNHYPRMDKWDIPNLQLIRYIKSNHTRSTMLSYRVGLDPVAASYLVGWIESSCNIPVNYATHCKKETPNETLV